MELIILMFLGYGIAFISVLAPGMINMTAVSVSLDKGKIEGIKFSIGASIAVFGQAFIAMYFSKYLSENPIVIKYLSISAIFVFLLLGILYLFKGKKNQKVNTKKSKEKSLSFGFGLSALNMMGIPFYLAVTTGLASKGYMHSCVVMTSVFSVSAALGAFTLFRLYVHYSPLIEKKANFISRNINYVLSALFFILSLITIYKTFA